MTTNDPEYMKAYRAANKDRIAAQMKVWAEQNPESIAASQAKYSKSKKGKATIAKNASTDLGKARRKRYASSAKGKAVVNTATAKRRAAELQRTPPWADMDAIKKVYAAAVFIHEELGYDLPHVDHIVPLQGKNVSGLHIAANLQLLSAAANTSKGNRHE